MEDSTYNTTSDESLTRPFTIALQRLDQTQNGNFRPGAFVKLTSSLRTSGFLQALPAEDVKNLLFLLSFVTPNGDCQPTVMQLADAMQVSQTKVRARMQRLERFQWQGKPVVIFLSRESGLDGYTIGSHVVAVQEEPPTPPAEMQPPAIQTAGREAVIAYSREHYARPRAEVERTIAENMGWELPEGAVDEATADTRRRLLGVGVTKDQADFLLGSYDLERIQRQLEWLPYRNAKNPAGFIVAAIEDDYEEPFALRIRRTTGDDTENVTTPSDSVSHHNDGGENDTEVGTDADTTQPL